jgi:hypothetical protein
VERQLHRDRRRRRGDARSLLGYVHDAVVRARFLGDRHLAQYADLLESVLR